jgi:ribonuclease P protein component
MKRWLRLKDDAAFQRVYRDGQSWTTPLVILRASPNSFPHNRIGFSTSKRLGSAVARNRVKRRLREAVRAAAGAAPAEMPSGMDLVLIARQPAHDAAFDRLVQTVRQLLAQARRAGADVRL